MPVSKTRRVGLNGGAPVPSVSSHAMLPPTPPLLCVQRLQLFPPLTLVLSPFGLCMLALLLLFDSPPFDSFSLGLLFSVWFSDSVWVSLHFLVPLSSLCGAVGEEEEELWSFPRMGKGHPRE